MSLRDEIRTSWTIADALNTIYREPGDQEIFEDMEWLPVESLKKRLKSMRSTAIRRNKKEKDSDNWLITEGMGAMCLMLLSELEEKQDE